MNDKVLYALVATYDDENSADQSLKMLVQSTRDGVIDIYDAAVIMKDLDGSIHVRDSANMSTGTGAAIGGLIGGVIGLLAGPAGMVLLAGTGAVIGSALTGGDEGIPDEKLFAMGENLKPDSSATVVIVEEVWVKDVETLLMQSSSQVDLREISPEITSQLLGDEGE
jgi:uncharacterized membrane protein